MSEQKPFQLKWWMVIGLFVAAACVAFQLDPINALLQQTLGLSKPTVFSLTALIVVLILALYKK